MAAAAAGAAGSVPPALAACSSGSGGAAPGSQGVLIGDRLYSGVLITLENCLLPDDKLRFTPSMSSGLDIDTETGLRVVGCELIQAAGILLRLPQVRTWPRALQATVHRPAESAGPLLSPCPLSGIKRTWTPAEVGAWSAPQSSHNPPEPVPQTRPLTALERGPRLAFPSPTVLGRKAFYPRKASRDRNPLGNGNCCGCLSGGLHKTCQPGQA